MNITTAPSANQALRFAYVASPLGRLLLVGNGGALTGLYLTEHGRVPEPAAGWREDTDGFRAIARQLAEYFAGQRRTFDLPLHLDGTPFQQRVWAALQEIPYGETTSYGALARRIGNPGASRAVGMANGRNPISIIVPCHRVVAADGGLGGYGWGTPRKEWLLGLERGEATLLG